MFEWIRERKLNRQVEKARSYIIEYYQEPPKNPVVNPNDLWSNQGIKYSHKDDSGIRYSRKSSDDDIKFSTKDDVGGTQFSIRDNYNTASIDRALRGIYADVSPTGAVRTLEKNTNMSFVDKMLDYINMKQMRDSDVYKAAQIDRRLFSKIVSDRTYKPAKDTCIALAYALHLSLADANDILSRAGYVLSHSSKRDVVLEYFFRESIYNMNDINEILYRLGEKTLGR